MINLGYSSVKVIPPSISGPNFIYEYDTILVENDTTILINSYPDSTVINEYIFEESTGLYLRKDGFVKANDGWRGILYELPDSERTEFFKELQAIINSMDTVPHLKTNVHK